MRAESKSSLRSDEFESYLRQPWRWVEFAVELARGKPEPARAGLILNSLARPLIPEVWRAALAFRELLRHPHRDRGLRWLDRHSLLEEIIPCWSRSPEWRAERLDAVEHVHLEAWREGLSPAAFQILADAHSLVLADGLNCWALTALATLLADPGDKSPRSWAASVEYCLRQLGFAPSEIEWVTEIVKHHSTLMGHLIGGSAPSTLNPGGAVCALSSLCARFGTNSPHVKKAARLVSRELEKTAHTSN